MELLLNQQEKVFHLKLLKTSWKISFAEDCAILNKSRCTPASILSTRCARIARLVKSALTRTQTQWHVQPTLIAMLKASAATVVQLVSTNNAYFLLQMLLVGAGVE